MLVMKSGTHEAHCVSLDSRDSSPSQSAPADGQSLRRQVLSSSQMAQIAASAVRTPATPVTVRLLPSATPTATAGCCRKSRLASLEASPILPAPHSICAPGGSGRDGRSYRPVRQGPWCADTSSWRTHEIREPTIPHLAEWCHKGSWFAGIGRAAVLRRIRSCLPPSLPRSGRGPSSRQPTEQCDRLQPGTVRLCTSSW